MPAMLIVFFAGVVRGYSGFGFAMIVALGLMFFMPPVHAIPMALLLDLVCSLGLLRRAMHRMHHAMTPRLIVGMLIATPLGVWLVAYLPAERISTLVAVVSLLGGLSILFGRKPRAPAIEPATPGRLERYAIPAGGVSGLSMTMASAGGPPLMLYLLNTSLPPTVMRATAIVFFMASSSCSLLGFALVGALTSDILTWGAMLVIPALGGSLGGQWLFHRSPPASLRWSVAPLLIGLSLWVLLGQPAH
nr:sulfite exporter TauE/SafE family protein [Halomonas populi]